MEAVLYRPTAPLTGSNKIYRIIYTTATFNIKQKQQVRFFSNLSKFIKHRTYKLHLKCELWYIQWSDTSVDTNPGIGLFFVFEPPLYVEH